MRGSAEVPFSQDGVEKKRTSTTLSVIVPAYNEQYLIATSLARLSFDGNSIFAVQAKISVDDLRFAGGSVI